MDLKRLEGKRTLDAVDMSVTNVVSCGYDEEANTVRFRLDGNVYEAIEDPDDGYRSYMGDITTPIDQTVNNVFPPVAVICVHDGDYFDILKINDAETGKTILEIGTDDVDDYYPIAIVRYDPTAMITNS